MTGIHEWLNELGLERFIETFEANEIDAEVLPDLVEADLEKIGIPLGPRKKMLKAISRLAAETTARTQSPEPDTRAAERRQLTVMFCDLVGSTALSEKLDPEEMREVMQAYQKTCGDVVERYAGHVAQYLGDGLMVYFGWPKAHEDDAARAIHAALEIIGAVKGVGAPEPLKVRVGVATGQVVVGETGAGDASVPKLAVGETPNLAARLQALAGEDAIVVGETTRRLAAGAFAYDDLGAQTLKGIVEPIPAFKVTGAGAAEGRFEAAHGARLTPFVGRDSEIALLAERWAQATGGEGQVVLIEGEPGIGKSRISGAFREQIAAEPHVRLLYQSSPFHANSAFYPITQQLERAARFVGSDDDDARLDKLEVLIDGKSSRLPASPPQRDAETLALLASLLSLPTDRYPALNMSPQKQKERTIEALVAETAKLATAQPLYMLFEDAHWIDPSTQEVLDQIIPAIESLPVLLVITFRPEFTPPWSHGHVSHARLNRLGKSPSAAMIDGVADGKPLPEEVTDQIVAKTDGVPLFIEELTKAVLESDMLIDNGDRYELSGSVDQLAIPATLQDSLMARLDKLLPVKEIAQIGACIGREFSHELLAAVYPKSEAELAEALTQLEGSEPVHRRGTAPNATYVFKHALVQDVAYESLLKSRRAQIHSGVADALLRHFPEVAETTPEAIAHHLTEAGRVEIAIDYWERAGALAAHRSNYLEAVVHLNKGLALVSSLQQSADPAETELTLLNILASPLMNTKGYASPEAKEVYERAHQLCRKIGGGGDQIYQALAGVSSYYMVVGDINTALALAEELLDLAEQQEDTGPLLEAHRSVALHCLASGQHRRSLKHSRKVQKIFDPARHRDLALIYGQDHLMSSHVLCMYCLGLLGYADQAIASKDAAIAESFKTNHYFSQAYALSNTLIPLAILRDIERMNETADAAISFCADQNIIFWLIWAQLGKGYLLGHTGQPEQGIKQLRDSIAQYRVTGSGLLIPFFNTILAELLIEIDQFDEAGALLDHAIDQIQRWGEGIYHAEALRVKGDLALKINADDRATAESWYCKAIDIAREQEAKLLELRAATSLARLWQSQGKRHEAHDLLGPVYDWFTEGFDTADLKDAKALLDELK